MKRAERISESCLAFTRTCSLAEDTRFAASTLACAFERRLLSGGVDHHASQAEDLVVEGVSPNFLTILAARLGGVEHEVGSGRVLRFSEVPATGEG